MSFFSEAKPALIIDNLWYPWGGDGVILCGAKQRSKVACYLVGVSLLTGAYVYRNTSNKPCLKYLIGFQAAAKRMQHWIKQLMAAMFSSCRVVMAQAMIVSSSELVGTGMANELTM